MTLLDELRALRHGAAFTRSSHVAVVRAGGAAAFEAMGALFPAELYLQDGQLVHTLLLGEDAVPVADVYVGLDDENFLVLAEGLTGEELVRTAEAHVPDARDVVFRSLDDHAVVSINGPFSWEVLAELLDPEVIGLPYLTFAKLDDLICVRAGKTGEYGYDLVVPREREADLLSRLRELGAGWDMIEAGIGALDHCALENWFFNIRREGRLGLTPIELQLQWRVSYRKPYPGSTALARRRARGASERITAVAAAGEIAAGDAVSADGEAVGRIVNAGLSPTRGDWIGLALLDIRWAHSGLDGLSANHGGSAIALRTASPPFIRNLSLEVSPQSHSYRQSRGRGGALPGT